MVYLRWGKKYLRNKITCVSASGDEWTTENENSLYTKIHMKYWMSVRVKSNDWIIDDNDEQFPSCTSTLLVGALCETPNSITNIPHLYHNTPSWCTPSGILNWSSYFIVNQCIRPCSQATIWKQKIEKCRHYRTYNYILWVNEKIPTIFSHNRQNRNSSIFHEFCCSNTFLCVTTVW